VRGDRYILRRPSPGETLGGGAIVDHQPKGRHKRFDEDVLKSLESLAKGSPSELLFEAALGLGIASIKNIFTRSRLEADTAQSALEESLKDGKLILLDSKDFKNDTLAATQSHWNTVRDKTMQLVESYHREYPLRRGIPREELKSRLKMNPRVFNAVINKLIEEQQLVEHLSFVAKDGFEIQFNGQEQAKVQALMRKFEQNPFSPPSVKECQAEAGEEVINALIDMNKLATVSPDVIFRKTDYDAMVDGIRNTITQNGKITLAEVRDLFNTSRKYAQALLEHLDATGVTMRDGDFRKLRK
jgi:selenocysteine-specific elongation factor